MKRFKDVDDAIRSLVRSEGIIKTLADDDYEIYGRLILWHMYNICEAALYICCVHDASHSGTISFPELNDLSKFNRIPEMDIPRDVRVAAKKISSYSKTDLEHDIDRIELYEAIQAVKLFLEWIRDNTRVEEIRHELERILNWNIFNRPIAI